MHRAVYVSEVCVFRRVHDALWNVLGTKTDNENIRHGKARRGIITNLFWIEAVCIIYAGE